MKQGEEREGSERVGEGTVKKKKIGQGGGGGEDTEGERRRVRETVYRKRRDMRE